MIEPIMIKVTDKVPELVSGPDYVVCDNSDYTVVWQLDEEWAQFEHRTMQVNYKDGTYERVLFTGNTCALPAIPVKDWFHVGLFAGDIHTTRPVKLFANRAITTDSGEERDPMPNGYAQAIEALDGKLDKNQGAENAGKALVVDEEGNVVPGKTQGSSLPAMSADTAGKMLTNDGEKAEWGDVPKEVMVVNFTQDDDGNWSADKSWDDAAALIESGGWVYAYDDNNVVFYPLYQYVPKTDSEIGTIRFYVASVGRTGAASVVLNWSFDASVDFTEDVLSLSDLPYVSFTKNQEVHAIRRAIARKNIGLTPVAKTDAMTQSVGLDAETGELYTTPAAGDNTLGITSATVGQIAKITAVDADGKPTAWEAVDMAGGDEWEYIGTATTNEDVAKMFLTVDKDNKPYSLKKFRMVGKLYGNAASAGGWVRACNGVSQMLTDSILYGFEAAEGQYRSFDLIGEIVAGIPRITLFLRSANVSSIKDLLSIPLLADIRLYSYAPYATANRLQAYTSLGLSGYQTGVLGAGTTFDIYGVGA